MKKENLFKWKHYQPDLILLTVRWYLRYNLSFLDLVEMMKKRVYLFLIPRLCVGFISMALNWTNEFVVTSSKPMTLGELMKHI
uniref:IS240 transposase n=1 Tax=Bacillus cereus VPC1401 TaxID=870739 RepID=E5AK73_BACCE|nr:IS240 transposase [Bacillus cereus VPC1401]